MKPPILRDFPESFETERLRIRSPLPGDGPEMHAAVNESLGELTPGCPGRKSIGPSRTPSERAPGAGQVRGREDLMLLLLLKGTGTLVGGSGLHRIDWAVPKFEIGYWCRTRFTGKGYVTEAVRGISAFALDLLGARRLEIRCDSRNLPSARVAERAGFRLEGELRNNELDTGGHLRNTLVYSMIPEEHEAVKGQNAS
jgi:RimJ/RimL family protein N-acetyltransferase